MDYGEFRSAFLAALEESGLPTIGRVPSEETVDLRTTARTLKVYVEPIGRDLGRPFHVSGTVWWVWDALQTARTATTEEDLLAELLGREDAHTVETEQPWLRVDLVLRAGLEYGKSLPMPSAASWKAWSREAIGRLEGIEPLVSDDVVREIAGGQHTVLAWQGDPEVKLTCNPLGELRLESLSVSAFQGIDLPRQWDDSTRTPDEHPRAQLTTMFRRLKAALHAWAEVMDHLR